MTERNKRVKATIRCLINNASTAVEIGRFVGCINAYNYISYARNHFNIPIIKEKKTGEILHRYRISKSGLDTANRFINGDAVTPPFNKINQQDAPINGDNL